MTGAKPYTFGYTLSGDTKLPGLLFLHGFLGSKNDWNPIVDPLKDDFCCLAVDLPGHGDTTVADDSLYRMENVASALTDLTGELGLSRPQVVGYSMGGRLALYLAVNHADSFSGFVLESASPGLKTAEERQARVEHDEALAQKLMSTDLKDFLADWYNQPIFETLRNDPRLLEETVKHRMTNNPAGLSRSLRYMGTGTQPSLWDRLHAITRPLLLIAGEHDTKYTAIQHQMADLCPTTQMRIILDCGHNVHLERPVEYIEAIKPFLLQNR